MKLSCRKRAMDEGMLCRERLASNSNSPDSGVSKPTGFGPASILDDAPQVACRIGRCATLALGSSGLAFSRWRDEAVSFWCGCRPAAWIACQTRSGVAGMSMRHAEIGQGIDDGVRDDAEGRGDAALAAAGKPRDGWSTAPSLSAVSNIGKSSARGMA